MDCSEGCGCCECGARDCPFDEPLHYHHDGCPACYMPPTAKIYDRAGVTIYHHDCRIVCANLAPCSVDAVVTDPPYGLSFMGKDWDRGVPGVGFWRLILGVMKPGAHLVAFGGTRTFHRLTCAIEDAGLEIRDCLGWLYGSGFPKGIDVSKAIDKAAGAEREVVSTKSMPDIRGDAYSTQNPKQGGSYSTMEYQVTKPSTPAAQFWDGWNVALKPSWEPIILARKPLEGTVAQNVLEHGTGGLNIDACRVETTEDTRRNACGGENGLCGSNTFKIRDRRATDQPSRAGRWPANILHDGSDEVVDLFPVTGPSSGRPRHNREFKSFVKWRDLPHTTHGHNDLGGSAARFFYCAKAGAKDRGINNHPTVKPQALMRWLCQLVTRPGGLILDPFMGSGSTLRAAADLNFRAIGIDIEEENCATAVGRLSQQVLQLEG